MASPCVAAVMTGKTASALATIQVYGDNAEAVLRQIFISAGNTVPHFSVGTILLGTIFQGDITIDQVTIGCEADRCFAIHSHGNPLIVERIMSLLRSLGVTLLDADQLLARIVSRTQSLPTCAIEANCAMTRAKTLLGTRHLSRQVTGGLTQALFQWQAVESLAVIQQAAHLILSSAPVARCIIHGCFLVLIGAPNAGKSTLLNCLAGQEKAIVTDIRGTTRDWIEVPCHLGPLYATLIDTAGLDPALTRSALDRQSQDRTVALLPRADLILLVLDVTQDVSQADKALRACRQTGRPVITVLNKNDCNAVMSVDSLGEILTPVVSISAQQQVGVDTLIDMITTVLGVNALTVGVPICFTDRQESLLEQLGGASSMTVAQDLITELLWGAIAD